MIRILVALSCCLLPVGVSGQESALRPDTILRAPERPALAILRTGRADVAALRVSIPIDEAPHEAGAGLLLAELGSARVAGAAHRIGADFTARRTHHGVVFTAAGAEVDLEYLGALLRSATAAPETDTPEIGRLRIQLVEASKQRDESPAEYVSASLVAQADPAAPPLGGTTETLDRLSLGRLMDVWRRSYSAAGMEVVAVTDLAPEVVQAALAGLGHDGPPEPSAETVDQAPIPVGGDGPPPTIRPWYGVGYVGGTRDDPHAAVLARILSERIAAEAPGLRALVQATALRAGHLFTVTAAARSNRRALEAQIDAAVPSLVESLDDGYVRRAVERVRLDFYAAAASPTGVAEAVGEHWDIGGEPASVLEWLARLDDVDAASLTSYLSSLRGPLSESVGR